eukprot:CAMPEP_0181405062 /NCGR_PEP_ID=MMETSP1110-20121109/4570_1 /TAXON_ID=174948 /ORGANISM="Symbiodinium sp., Strain CCMP421" /LENGTH=231 /DNA_ID=CAMNT_0023527447 /DNA_START=23 /DNA_END=717 /DNA_ORIENTATION=+
MARAAWFKLEVLMKSRVLPKGARPFEFFIGDGALGESTEAARRAPSSGELDWERPGADWIQSLLCLAHQLIWCFACWRERARRWVSGLGPGGATLRGPEDVLHLPFQAQVQVLRGGEARGFRQLREDALAVLLVHCQDAVPGLDVPGGPPLVAASMRTLHFSKVPLGNGRERADPRVDHGHFHWHLIRGPPHVEAQAAHWIVRLWPRPGARSRQPDFKAHSCAVYIAASSQ